jgi:hypothetical protein
MQLEANRDTPHLLQEFGRFVTNWARPGTQALQPLVWPTGLLVPRELRAFYEIAYKFPDARLSGTQDFLVPLEDLKYEDSKLAFVSENQGNFTVAVESHGDHWFLSYCAYWNNDAWLPVLEGLAEFLVNFGHQELLLGARYVYEIDE